MDHTGVFDDARWALFWSADVLRRRYLPRAGAFWREAGAGCGAEGTAELEALAPAEPAPHAASRLHLPGDEDARYALALKVDGVLRALGEPGLLLRQLAWGDAWCDASLQAALHHREKARRLGMRLRFNYRYTYRQLAALHDCEAKSIWRRVRKALGLFEAALQRGGLLWAGAPDGLKSVVNAGEMQISLDKCHNLG